MKKLLFVFIFIGNTTSNATWHDGWKNTPAQFIRLKTLPPKKNVLTYLNMLVLPASNITDDYITANNGRIVNCGFLSKAAQSSVILVDIYYFRLLAYLFSRMPDIVKNDVTGIKNTFCTIKNKLTPKKKHHLQIL